MVSYPPEEEVSQTAAEVSGNESPLILENPAAVWRAALQGLTGMAADLAKPAERVTFNPPNRLVVTLSGNTFAKAFCERPENLGRFERAVAEQTGHALRIEFVVAPPDPAKTAATAAPKAVSQHQLMMEVMQDPMVRRAAELFGAQPVRVEAPGEQ